MRTCRRRVARGAMVGWRPSGCKRATAWEQEASRRERRLRHHRDRLRREATAGSSHRSPHPRRARSRRPRPQRGSGRGLLEPADLPVLAVEPSREMIRQRPAGRAAVVQALAEQLPFPSASFDAALAVLTVHHWSDRRGGLTELARVACRVVIVTWDHACRDLFWLTSEYLPEIIELDLTRFPTREEFSRALGPIGA